MALFDSLGAQPWAEKARAELARDQRARRAASDELTTKAERQVAELAAEGRKNKEIAAAMFVTVGTVETHLSRVYRKLGVRLARRAGRPLHQGWGRESRGPNGPNMRGSPVSTGVAAP